MAKVCTVQKKKTPSYEVRDIQFAEPPLALTEEEAEKQAARIIKDFLDPVKSKKLDSRCNRPDAIRKEFLKYLRAGFGYQEDFKHPILDETFSNQLVHQKLFELKNHFALKESSQSSRLSSHTIARSCSSADVRNAFLNYLKIEFPTGADWRNPLTNRTYTSIEIRTTLKHYQEAYNGISSLHYKSLWCLFTTQASRAFIANNFGFEDNSVLRLWHDAVDGVIVLLEYKDLNPNEGGSYHKDYHALWCLISTRTTRSQASEYFNLSDSSIKRLWNDLIDPVLLTLAYPELSIEKAMGMYRNRG
jgi:hypothetical protein